MSDSLSLRTDEAVLVKGLRFSYEPGDGPRLFNDLDLSVHFTAAVAIMGRSGSGKTTLLNLIAGLQRPRFGVIRHNVPSGHQSIYMSSARPRAAILFRRRYIGMVFQRFNLLSDLTVFQNVAIAARLSGMSATFANQRTLEALAAVGLKEMASRMPHTLSGGEAQRVGIARAIVKRPTLLLADEPTGNLDTSSARLVLQVLHSARETLGAALVVITHDSTVAGSCHLTFEVANGKLRPIT